jgi:hypothetical protein
MKEFSVQVSGQNPTTNGWVAKFLTIKAKSDIEAGEKGIKRAKLANSRVFRVIELRGKLDPSAPF